MEGAKLMKCLFNSQCCSKATAKGQWHCYVLGFKTGHRQGTQRFPLSECTFVTAPHKRATHHAMQGCVQWKSIMLWCIDLYHLDSWQVTERCFGGRDLGLCLSFIRDQGRFMWSGPYPVGMMARTKTQWLHTEIQAVPHTERNHPFQSAGIVLCSRK